MIDPSALRVGDETFYLRVKELRNVLVGDDFAVLEVTSRPPESRSNEEADDPE